MIEPDTAEIKEYEVVGQSPWFRTLRTVAYRWSTRRTSRAIALIDAILHTVARSRHPATGVVYLRCDRLGDEFGCTARSVQQILKDLEDVGFCARGVGGQADGYTSLRLTEEAVRDPNVKTVLDLYALLCSGSRKAQNCSWLDPDGPQRHSAQDRPHLRRYRHG